MMQNQWEELLHTHFGHTAFREGQARIIQSIMAGENVLGIMATGGGKSITYQLPALLLPGISIVVSPLISLMIDQVHRLRQRRTLSAAYLNSTLDFAQTRQLLAEIEQGRYRLLYISPEKLQQPFVQERLRRRGVSLVAIDEAHCISQWGHDFRVDYLRLPDTVKQLGAPPVLAVTATATPHVREEICRLFGIRPDHVIAQTVNRPNIAIDLIEVADESEKRARLFQAVKSLQGPGIVYCRTRQAVEQLTQLCLETREIRAEGYHAGMPAMERVLVQEQFLAGKLDVIFATNAFGMGIDKPDIRYVLHYHFPGSLEEYTQEIGRIGRDGQPGYAGMLLNPEDVSIHHYMLTNEYPVKEEIERFVHLLAEYQPCVTPLEVAAKAGLPEESLDMLLFYAQQQQLISQLEKSKDEIRYKLHADSIPTAVSQMAETMERLKRIRRGKLRQMTAWISEQGCLREALTDYFEGRRVAEYTTQCCSHCGIDRSVYEKNQAAVSTEQAKPWDLQNALNQLFRSRHEGGERS